jgi:hypothetical protein
MKVTSVPYEYVNEIWPDVAKMISPSVKYNNGRYHVDDIYKGLMDQNMQLWLAFDYSQKAGNGIDVYGSIVTSISQYPRKKCLTIMFVGGRKISLWLNEIHDMMYKFAKDCNCDSIEGYGRLGWGRLLNKFGGKRYLSLFEKEIEA